jgi:hypothetical protein
MTKTLRTSGGDWSTLQQAIDFILSAALSEDLLINVQGGASFGSVAVENAIEDLVDPLDLNGFNVTFQTNPGEASTPAILLGDWKVRDYYGGSSNGKIIFRNIKLAADLSQGAMFKLRDVSTIVEGRNCLLYLKNVSNTTTFLFQLNNVGNGVRLLNECSIFMTALDSDGITVVHAADPDLVTATAYAEVKNSLLATYNSVVVSVPYSFTYGTHQNNTFVNYYATGKVRILNNSSTTPSSTPVSDGLAQDTPIPALEDLIIQSPTDAPLTMLARSAYPTGSSTPILDNADSATAESVDIVGTARPQGVADDRGAYEFILPNTAPEIEIDSIVIV